MKNSLKWTDKYDEFEDNEYISRKKLDLHTLLFMNNFCEDKTKGKCIGRLTQDYKGFIAGTVLLLDYRKLFECYVLTVFEYGYSEKKLRGEVVIVTRDIPSLIKVIEDIPFADDEYLIATEKLQKGDKKLFAGIKPINNSL
jgi:hypothetical protein